MAFTVFRIWSIASSSELDQLLDVAKRSNGVMKVQRTAVSTSRAMASASFSCWNPRGASFGDAHPALQQIVQRGGAETEGGGVAVEHLEEAVFPGHQRLEPSEHYGLNQVAEGKIAYTMRLSHHVRLARSMRRRAMSPNLREVRLRALADRGKSGMVACVQPRVSVFMPPDLLARCAFSFSPCFCWRSSGAASDGSGIAAPMQGVSTNVPTLPWR